MTNDVHVEWTVAQSATASAGCVTEMDAVSRARNTFALTFLRDHNRARSSSAIVAVEAEGQEIACFGEVGLKSARACDNVRVCDTVRSTVNRESHLTLPA